MILKPFRLLVMQAHALGSFNHHVINAISVKPFILSAKAVTPLNLVCTLFRDSARCTFSRVRAVRGCLSTAGRPPDPVTTENPPQINGIYQHSFSLSIYRSHHSRLSALLQTACRSSVPPASPRKAHRAGGPHDRGRRSCNQNSACAKVSLP